MCAAVSAWIYRNRSINTSYVLTLLHDLYRVNLILSFDEFESGSNNEFYV